MSEETKRNHPKQCPPVGTWLRHKDTGNLARVIEKEDGTWIKPDLPGSPVYYPSTQYYNWYIEEHAKRLPPGSYARVAYEAWRALCEIHPELKRQPDWLSLAPMVKAKWIERKIKFDKPVEVALFESIMYVLEQNSE
jgi:hypothetical protein